jgi:2-methylisocitrate lyase-like PEP mutase family enzyme
MTKHQEFAALHHGQRPFVLPNAWDVASALLLQEAGFAAVATTSLGVNAAAGLADASGAGRDVALDLGRTLAGRLRVPVTVDFEGGYSDDPAAVASLAAQLADAGVAGINLEDGLPGGALRPASQHVAVIAAVVATVPGLFVNARTDTYWLRTPAPAQRLGETLRRVEAYRDAGAHGVFVPGLTGRADTAAVAARAGVPLNVLWQPGVRLADLADAGVARVSTGSALYRAALGAALRAAAEAREAPDQPPGPVGYDEVQRVLLAAAPESAREDSGP